LAFTPVREAIHTAPKDTTPVERDSGEIDFSGLLDKVNKSGRPSSASSSQDDLLKSLEGLTLDLPDGRSPDESTDEELDSLLSDFGSTIKGAQARGGGGKTPPHRAPAKGRVGESGDLGLEELLGPSATKAPAKGVDFDLDLPPLKPGAKAPGGGGKLATSVPDLDLELGPSKPKAPPPVDLDLDLPPLKPGVKPGVKPAAGPVAKPVAPPKMDDLDFDLDLPPLKSGVKPAAPHAKLATPSAEALGIDLPPMKPGVKPVSPKAPEPPKPPPAKPAAGPPEISGSLDIDDMIDESVVPTAKPGKSDGKGGSIIDELEDLFSSPRSPTGAAAKPAAKPAAGPASRSDDLDLDDLLGGGAKPAAKPAAGAKPAAPAGAKPAVADDLDDFLSELAGGSKPAAKAPERPAAKGGLADDLLDELGLPKPPAQAPVVKSAKPATPKPDDEEQSLDDFLAELGSESS
jgi:hypothetical protein